MNELGANAQGRKEYRVEIGTDDEIKYRIRYKKCIGITWNIYLRAATVAKSEGQSSSNCSRHHCLYMVSQGTYRLLLCTACTLLPCCKIIGTSSQDESISFQCHLNI